MKTIVKYIKVFLLLITIFFTYSVISCLLPNKQIKYHIEKSLPDLLIHDNYPKAIINQKQCQLDNFTDVLFLSQNYAIDPKTPIQSSMLVPLSTFKKNGKFVWNRAETLEQQIKGNPDVRYLNYTRYWHGNTFLLRLLLVFTDFTTIRWILYVVSSLLMFVLFAKLYKNSGLLKTITFAFGLLCVNIFVTQFSMQLFTVPALGIIASILICNKYKSQSNSLPMIFFVIGCLTSYFDLLTAPLLSLGLPLIVFLMLQEKLFIDIDSRKLFKKIILFSALWTIGYACTWVSKWTLGSILTNENVFKGALYNILVRSGADNFTSVGSFSRIDAIVRNINLLPLVFINITISISMFFAIIFFDKTKIKTSALFLFIALFPYLWFFILANHSYIHSWFTYRIQAISIICIILMFLNLISFDKIARLKTLFKRKQ